MTFILKRILEKSRPKENISETQNGFRKGISWTETLFYTNYRLRKKTKHTFILNNKCR